MTNYKDYLKPFQNLSKKIEKEQLKKKQLEIASGEFLDSACIKLYKTSWANPGENALTAKSRIFFSVWLDNKGIKSQKIFYNIHALKLRELKAYSIQSREFAEVFRNKLKVSKTKWTNLNTNLGPLTLMEGWVKLNDETLEEDILYLVHNFLKMDYLIDETLLEFKK